MVEEIVEPRKELRELSKKLFDKSFYYDKNDYVIIMFNTHNISNNRHLILALKHILSASKLSNIIIISECQKPVDDKINKKMISILFRLRKKKQVMFFLCQSTRNLDTKLKSVIK